MSKPQINVDCYLKPPEPLAVEAKTLKAEIIGDNAAINTVVKRKKTSAFDKTELD